VRIEIGRIDPDSAVENLIAITSLNGGFACARREKRDNREEAEAQEERHRKLKRRVR
jgi:hypothetical protein